MEANGDCGNLFDSLEEARSAVIALREDVEADPEMEWATTVLEKMETVPLDRAAVLALLNDGPGGVVARCEIVETFGPMVARGSSSRV